MQATAARIEATSFDKNTAKSVRAALREKI